MEYLIVAYDKKDAFDKRMSVRDEHVKGAKELINKGKILKAGAIMSDGKMIGSSLFVDFKTKAELDEWLKNEPYVKNGVWDMEKIQIIEVKLLQ